MKASLKDLGDVMGAFRARKNYLDSAIILQAKLNCRLSSIAKAMEAYPGVYLTQSGTSLLYSIGGEADDHYYTIELSSSYIRLAIYSEYSPIYLMKEALLRLMSIISFLNDRYNVNISSIFPYLVELIADGQLNYYSGIISSISGRETSDSYIVLAKRVNYLKAENSRLQSELSESNERIGSMLEWLLILEGMHSAASIEKLSEKYKVRKEEIEAALKRLQSKGYKVIYNSKDLFTLVGT